MFIGLSTAISAALGTPFDPRSLFNDGSIGVLYDNNDLSTFFSDSAGTTAAVVNGPVGLQLDKSQGLVLGAELLTNGDFSNGATGWTVPAGWVIGSGTATSSASSSSLIGTGFSPVSGRFYRVEFDVVSYSVGTLFIAVGRNYTTSVSLTGGGMVAGRKSILVQAGSDSSRPIEFYGGAVTCVLDNISVRELPGNHRYQTTATSRPTLRGTPNGLDGDGTDDSMLVASGGGGTTGFLFQSAIKLDAINKRQTLWSDAGTNTGYKVEINASNQLVFSAGNGTAYTSVTTANTVAAGTTYSVECYDDGTNLVAILNQGTPATAARPTVSAGTTGFTMQKDNGAASGFMDGLLCSVIYLRNTAKNSATRAQSMRWIRQKAGL